MPKPMGSTNVLLAIILVLVILLIVNIVYGCKLPSMKETFEDKVMTEEGSSKPTTEGAAKPPSKEASKDVTSNVEAPKEVESDKKDTTKVVISKGVETVHVPKDETMTKKEKELFKSIVQEKFSTQDLEKLVKAGVLTENTIEKFLNEMEEAKNPLEGADTVEGFSCQRDYATF